MFTFGLFSTHLPYLVFAFFYLTFYVSTLQKGKHDQVNDAKIANNELSIGQQSCSVTGSCFVMKSGIPDSSTNQLTGTGCFSFRISTDIIEIVPDFETDCPLTGRFSGAIFNRPPPSIFNMAV